MGRFFGVFCLCVMNLLFFQLGGCSSSGLVKIKDGALELVGMDKKSDQPARDAKFPIQIQIYAGGNLNADEHGRPMAVVFKFYRLRDPGAFMQASYDVLSDVQKERAALAADIVEVKELVVTPGQDFQRTEFLSIETGYIGVVALFRKPFPERWRMVFSGTQPSNRLGVVIGAHACALTVSKGVPFNAQLINAGSLGGVVCR